MKSNVIMIKTLHNIDTSLVNSLDQLIVINSHLYYMITSLYCNGFCNM